MAFVDDTSGRKILIRTEKRHYTDAISTAAKNCLEIIFGLHLPTHPSDKIVVNDVGSITIEDVSDEFRNHLTKFDFDSGRFVIDHNKEGKVLLGGGLLDHKANVGFLWVCLGEDFPTIGSAARFGRELLQALKLKDDDHGIHTVSGDGPMYVVDDSGHRIAMQ